MSEEMEMRGDLGGGDAGGGGDERRWWWRGCWWKERGWVWEVMGMLVEGERVGLGGGEDAGGGGDERKGGDRGGRREMEVRRKGERDWRRMSES